MGADTESQGVSVKLAFALLVTTVICQSYALFLPALVLFLVLCGWKDNQYVPFLNSEIRM